MYMLQKACCCLQLKTGALILGWLDCILSVFSFLLIMVELYGYPSTYQIERFTVVKLVLTAIKFAVNVELIRGAQTSNRRRLLPWIWYTGILFFISNGITACRLAVDPFTLDQLLILVITILITDVWWMYAWFCVYCYYKELKCIDVLV